MRVWHCNLWGELALAGRSPVPQRYLELGRRVFDDAWGNVKRPLVLSRDDVSFWEDALEEIPSDELILPLPWMWTPKAWAFWQDRRSRVDASDDYGQWLHSMLERPTFPHFFAQANSKAFACECARRLPEQPTHPLFLELSSMGEVTDDVTRILEVSRLRWKRGETVLLKAPLAAFGRGLLRLRGPEDWNESAQGWVRRTLSSQGSVVLQRWFPRRADFSISGWVGTPPWPLNPEFHRNDVDALGVFRASVDGNPWSGLDADVRSLFDEELLNTWLAVFQQVTSLWGNMGYQGPIGVDAMLVEPTPGDLRLVPLVEVNARWTMNLLNRVAR